MNKPPTEYQEQAALVVWLDETYPDLIYYFNYLAGAKLPIGLAVKAKRLGAKKDYPDCFIAEAKGGYHGLYLELKRTGTRLHKRNGEWTNAHYEAQANMLHRLGLRGYKAVFSIGLEESKSIIKEYLELC